LKSKLKQSKSLRIFFLTLSVGLVSPIALAKKAQKNINYKIKSYQCPKKAVGELTLRLMKVFERHRSLKDIKFAIQKNGYKDKYFVDEYKVSYSPLTKNLRFSFYCSNPLMNIEIYDEFGGKSFQGVLVSSGKVFEKDYLRLINNDRKKDLELPYLSLPAKKLESEMPKQISKLFKALTPKSRAKVSEIILNNDQELTMILMSRKSPTSVFVGKDEWDEKFQKLQKLINYFEQNAQEPQLVNLTNSKKIVVKF
ncbi:MAG: cell division protein FtsQ/DivIB, partial [Bacteriovoracaceae bacterium]